MDMCVNNAPILTPYHRAGSTADRGGQFSRAADKGFVRANFEWADLTESDMRGCDLAGANLHGVYLTERGTAQRVRSH